MKDEAATPHRLLHPVFERLKLKRSVFPSSFCKKIRKFQTSSKLFKIL